MDTVDYEIMLDLYELGSITKVAQKRFVSQPAMTKIIKRIEAELGCEVVLRGQRGVTFTPTGESIIPYCRKMVSLNRSLHDHVNRSRGIVSGQLNLWCCPSYTRFALPPTLREYCIRYPLVTPNVQTANSLTIYDHLLHRDDCIGILRGDYKWEDGKFLLSEEPMCLVSSPENLDKPLDSYPYIGRHTDSTNTSLMQRWVSENGGNILRPKIWVDDINNCKELCQHGVGWCILPKLCLLDCDPASTRNLYFADGTPFTRSTYVFYRKAYLERQRQIRLFLEMLIDRQKIVTAMLNEI